MRRLKMIFWYFAERGVWSQAGYDDHQEWDWLGSGTSSPYNFSIVKAA